MQIRPYQQAAREAVHREWDEGRNRTLLVLPTGCGKTIVFAKITEDEVRSGSRVLILAHRGELLQQAADKLERTSGLKCAGKIKKTDRFVQSACGYLSKSSLWLPVRVRYRNNVSSAIS